MPSSRPAVSTKNLDEIEAEDLRHGGQALYRCLLSRRAVRGHHAHHPRRKARPSRPRARSSSIPAGWPSTASRPPAMTSRRFARVAPASPPTTRDIEIKENQTKPPARFTEATLLSAMEGAGKLVEDEELREAMSSARSRHSRHPRANHRRADSRGYINRQGRELIVTAKGTVADHPAPRNRHPRR